MLKRLKQNRFLFEELVKRDFNKRYKRTALGVFWSIISPLLMLLVMKVVFTQFFGRTIEHYTTYVFAGIIVFYYFSDATNDAMGVLISNAGIISKVNVPKYMFLLSSSVATFFNFLASLAVFFVFVMIDKIPFTFTFLALVYPILWLTLFNTGMGMILSTMFVFFRDTKYLYRVFTRLLFYMSAVFYNVDKYPVEYQNLFLINPVYVYIQSVRSIVLDGQLPSMLLLSLCALYAVVAFFFGALFYKKSTHKFPYYM